MFIPLIQYDSYMHDKRSRREQFKQISGKWSSKVVIILLHPPSSTANIVTDQDSRGIGYYTRFACDRKLSRKEQEQGDPCFLSFRVAKQGFQNGSTDHGCQTTAWQWFCFIFFYCYNVIWQPQFLPFPVAANLSVPLLYDAFRKCFRTFLPGLPVDCS